MGEKRKWERDYEKYSSSTELNERVNELQEKIDNNTATRELFEEHKKLTAIKNNLPKVQHILELRDKLNGQIKEIDEEIARREKFGKYDKAIQILEEEMQELDKEYNSLHEQIKNPDLKPEEKTELQNKLDQNKAKRQKNNERFAMCQEEKAKGKEAEEKSKFKDKTVEDLKNEKTELTQQRSTCNYACNKLMQGYSWQSVEVALDKMKNQKFTAKGENADKMKRNREAAKSEKAKTEPEKVESEEEVVLISDEDEVEVEVGEEVEEEKEGTELKVPTRWDKVKAFAKGIFAKGIFKTIKEKYNEFRGKTKTEKEPEKTEAEKAKWEKECKEAVIEGRVEKETVETNQNDFRKYLREVAEKGMDGVAQEQKDAVTKNAVETLMDNSNKANGKVDLGTMERREKILAEIQARQNKDEGR